MKNKPKGVSSNDQLSIATISEQIGEENMAQAPRAKLLKDIRSKKKKKEENKPIYLVRYE
jgi:hypothetical protein